MRRWGFRGSRRGTAARVGAVHHRGIRVEADRHHVVLPRIGRVRTQESTRKLARRLEAGTARILSATVRFTGALAVRVSGDRGRQVPPRPRPPIRAPGGRCRCGGQGSARGRHRRRERRLFESRRPNHWPGAVSAAGGPTAAARRCGTYDPHTETRREPSKRWAALTPGWAGFMRRWPRSAPMRSTRPPLALVTAHDTVVVEQLAAKNMSRRGGRRKRGLNRALGDAAIGRIRTQLHYKTTWYGTTLVTAPRLFPSTQLCSRCEVKTKLRLRDRIYRCRTGCPPIDRDLNAAINLARLGDASHGGTGTGTGSRPAASVRLETDVEPTRRPAPQPRWGRQEATKRQPRTPIRRGRQLRKEKLPEI